MFPRLAYFILALLAIDSAIAACDSTHTSLCCIANQKRGKLTGTNCVPSAFQSKNVLCVQTKLCCKNYNSKTKLATSCVKG
ncbi:hypothetical protein PAXRUDRAFT_20761 [Paxillus rubicundulus Ve08.2h10]|uniref:Hydrophobin n=1 Tax=Paxillus rubicundulus Ve08.2h10 TaxID=930991 RepID=A0A0D0D124_9AGAM|nr:hypothetical protein PAXRUDRAFT_20761 [Paxillus rubicundulus Ve08.2h10]